MTRREFCPYCEEDRFCVPRDETKTLTVRKEPFEVPQRVLVCEECGGAFRDPNSTDPIDLAFDEYRKKHGLLFPNEIKAIRERWAMGREAMGLLLAIGQASLARYEVGALPDELHNNDIARFKNPSAVVVALRCRGHKLSNHQIEKITRALHEAFEARFDYESRGYGSEIAFSDTANYKGMHA